MLDNFSANFINKSFGNNKDICQMTTFSYHVCVNKFEVQTVEICAYCNWLAGNSL